MRNTTGSGGPRSWREILFGTATQRAGERSDSRWFVLAALLWVLVCLGAALALGHWGEEASRLQTTFWILAALGVLFLFQQLGIFLLAHTIGTRILLVILLPVVLGYGLWRIFTVLAGG